MLLPYGAGALTADDVKLWAEMLSVDLTDFAKKGLRYEEIQQLYENAQYATKYVNGTAKILELREKLGEYLHAYILNINSCWCPGSSWRMHEDNLHCVRYEQP